jgi:hypothetical protein
MTTHNPMTPDWTCEVCGEGWPCPPSRRELLDRYDGALVALSVYLGQRYVTATADLPDLPAGQLYQRIVGWARERPYPSADEVLAHSVGQVRAHVSDGAGRCRVCAGVCPCWVATDAMERLTAAGWAVPDEHPATR